jgi:hypothetical protein
VLGCSDGTIVALQTALLRPDFEGSRAADGADPAGVIAGLSR